MNEISIKTLNNLSSLNLIDIRRNYLYEKVNTIYINNDKTINIEYKNDNNDV